MSFINGSCSSHYTFQELEDHKYFLAYSNIAFLVPIIYCIFNTFYNKLKWNTYIIEILLIFLTGFNSLFYHLCDELPCVAYCIAPYHNLQIRDFAFSFNLVPIILFYLLEIEFSWYKILLNIITLSLNFEFFSNYANTLNASTIYYEVLTITITVLILCRIIYLLCKKELMQHFEHFDWINGFVALVLAITAFALKVYGDTRPLIDNKQPINYYWYHSWWHITIAFSLLFVFNIFHASRTFIFFPKVNYSCFNCKKYTKSYNIINAQSVDATNNI